MIALPDRAFRRLTSLARAEAGLNLQDGKRSFVASRLQRRLRATGAADFDAYVHLVEGTDPSATEERRHLISALTTNVTGIFRESHHFALLAKFVRGLPEDRPIRVWSAGCSTGEETLSIAATCRSVIGSKWTARCRVLATDIDGAALARATAQRDNAGVVSQLREGLAALGLPDEGTLQLGDLLAGITYMRHNLLEPLPADTAFDVIFCRNVTIYFDAPIQVAVQEMLAARLAPRALLCLGHSERLQADGKGLRLVGPTCYARPAAIAGDAAWP